jgi:hypothetical protein
MTNAHRQSAGRSLLLLFVLSLLGVLLAPLVVYWFGSTVMAPYEGDSGLSGFLASVYSAALAARPGALALILSPAGLLLTWWLIFKLLSVSRNTLESDDNNH